MRKLHTLLLGGAGLLLAAGAAVAAEKYDHVMTVALPDGSVAQIHYDGKVAPRLVVREAAPSVIAFADPSSLFDAPDLADFDRIAAMMERQHADMMQRVAQMQAQMDEVAHQAAQTQTVSARDGAKAPAGMVSYSFVSTSSSDGRCTQTVQWSSDGSNAQPKVYKASSGDCAKGEEMKPDAPQKVSAPVPAPDLPVPGAAKI